MHTDSERIAGKNLAKALQSHANKLAFQKEIEVDDRPRADDLERMVTSFPGLDQIDWDAEPVESGINCELWKAWHARHCSACTPTTIHDDCYFKVIYHFLRTGFNPPEVPQEQPADKSKEEGTATPTEDLRQQDGFNANPNPRPPEQKPNRATRRAYVNKWRREERRCKKAYNKWVNECTGLISEICSEVPEFFSPMLPVARKKDKWR